MFRLTAIPARTNAYQGVITGHSASLRAFTPVFDGLWTRVNALLTCQCIHLHKALLTNKLDARVISAFTRVFDALLPAYDGLEARRSRPLVG
jgi:hypothetical protein